MKIPIFPSKYPSKWWIFHGYVSLRECTSNNSSRGLKGSVFHGELNPSPFPGKDREKSLALLMMCSFKRAFWLDYATGLSGWKPADKNYISPRSKEAMLLTNWVRTGFDDLIWRSLSADPTERPLPSEILTSLWFTNESLVLEEGSTLQFTCPYMETPPGIVSLFFSLLVFLCMGIATVVLGLHEIIVKIKAGQSMSPYVWEPVGGIYIICSSLCVMAWLDYGLIYWVIMAPLGLFTMLGSTLEIFKDWQSLDAFQGLHLAKRGTSHQSRGFFCWFSVVFCLPCTHKSGLKITIPKHRKR